MNWEEKCIIIGFYMIITFKFADLVLEIFFKLQDDFWYWMYYKKTGDDFEERFKKHE